MGVEGKEFPGVYIEERAFGNPGGEEGSGISRAGLFKKNSCGISMGLGFWPWNFQEGMSHNHTVLQNF